MNAYRTVKVIAAACVVLASVSAYAQATDADSTAQPGSANTSKAMRKTDRTLARKVRGALAKTEGISVANVVVRARSGAVTLEGTVPEEDQIGQAVQIAQGVQGVTSVKNALSIRPVGQ
jgi:hyperosmotically inducible periplasmic protein